MKLRKWKIVMLTTGVVLFGCKEFFVDEIKLFIPGTYIRYATHEFGKEYDTITITLEDEAAEAYKITRRWRYERMRDTELLEPEYKITMTIGYYQQSRNQMWENGSGAIYMFDVKKKLLKNGSIKYLKL